MPPPPLCRPLRISPRQPPASALALIPDLNIFPVLKDGDFRLVEGDVPSQPQNIPTSIGVPVVQSPAVVTRPRSYSETFQSFRTAACEAHGTGLGTPSLVRCCGRASLASDLRTRSGLLIFSPVERPARLISPRSMPTSPVPTGRSSAISQTKLRNHRPVASWLKLPERMSVGIA